MASHPASNLDATERFAFGDTPAMADALLALVLAGTKTATCWAAREGTKGSVVGARYIVLDGTGYDAALIESTELVQRRFDKVDAGFARDEGEGDRTLADWATGHREYFERNGGFTPDMLLWCERFRLVVRL